jgi:hypothetical protein
MHKPTATARTETLTKNRERTNQATSLLYKNDVSFNLSLMLPEGENYFPKIFPDFTPLSRLF